MTSRLNRCLATKKQPRKATKKPPIDQISRRLSSIRCSISGAEDFSTSSSSTRSRRRLRVLRGGVFWQRPGFAAALARRAFWLANFRQARRFACSAFGFGGLCSSRFGFLSRRGAAGQQRRSPTLAGRPRHSSPGIKGAGGIVSGPATPGIAVAPFFSGSAGWVTARCRRRPVAAGGGDFSVIEPGAHVGGRLLERIELLPDFIGRD